MTYYKYEYEMTLMFFFVSLDAFIHKGIISNYLKFEHFGFNKLLTNVPITKGIWQTYK